MHNAKKSCLLDSKESTSASTLTNIPHSYSESQKWRRCVFLICCLIVEFEVNLVITFQDDTVVTENFPIKVVRVSWRLFTYITDITLYWLVYPGKFIYAWSCSTMSKRQEKQCIDRQLQVQKKTSWQLTCAWHKLIGADMIVSLLSVSCWHIYN